MPLTKQKKPDYISYIITQEKYEYLKYEKSYILLDQIRTISKKRLLWKKFIWMISSEDFYRITEKFYKLIKKNKPNKNRSIKPAKGISEDLK